MASRKKLIILCLTLFLVTIVWAKLDPELETKLEQCYIRCGQHRKVGEPEVQWCRSKCEKCYEEETESEQKREDQKEVYKKLSECEGKCEKKHDDRKKFECHARCYAEFLKEISEEDVGNRRSEGVEREKRSETEQGKPYVFQDQHFSTKHQTDHGRFSILQKFNQRSDLLPGIENYRVSIFEANRPTFIMPNHWDADAIVFVHQGRGTMSLVWQDKRESFNVQRGDVLTVRAGTTLSMVNHDNVVIITLIQTVSTPGQFETFFGPGGENPKSFFNGFSPQLLEAAFNMIRDTFKQLFQRKEGMIIKASEEQIKGMSQKDEGGIWPFGSDKGPFNLFKQHPSLSNQHGHEVDQSECKDLQELDLTVSFADITRGSMTAPMFNSKATKISVVVSGEGYLEIACPHVSSFGHSQTAPNYKSVRANLRFGTVFVVPAGHPFITVASQNDNLQVICFEVNAENNEKVQLAGKKNIFDHFEKMAKGLAFGVSEQQVDEVFKSQDEEFFLKGSRQQHEGRAYA